MGRAVEFHTMDRRVMGMLESRQITKVWNKLNRKTMAHHRMLRIPKNIYIKTTMSQHQKETANRSTTNSRRRVKSLILTSVTFPGRLSSLEAKNNKLLRLGSRKGLHRNFKGLNS